MSWPFSRLPECSNGSLHQLMKEETMGGFHENLKDQT